MRDTSASIIDLAVRGSQNCKANQLVVLLGKRRYRFIKLKGPRTQGFRQLLTRSSAIKVLLSDLQEKFSP